MFSIGRVCIKIAGRDAGKKCVIISVLDDKNVMIDGMTRRRKCNKLHLEPTATKLDIAENASHEAIAKAFKELGFEVVTKKSKAKTEKPKSISHTNKKEVANEGKDKKKKVSKKA
jgi:large subunit ribosomal protein L14e